MTSGAVEKIRIVLVEDQALVLGAIAAMLEREPDIEIAATATDAESAIEVIGKERPDVVITDIELPSASGLDIAERLLEAGERPRVVMLTTFARPGYFERAMQAGASGYVLKDTPAHELAGYIRRVHRGDKVYDPALVAATWSSPNPLSRREQECLRLASEGLANSAIAERIHLSEGTVRNYLSSAIGKLAAGNRIEAARIAKQKGWI
jgi:two-component system response regulator DesR